MITFVSDKVEAVEYILQETNIQKCIQLCLAFIYSEIFFVEEAIANGKATLINQDEEIL